jgi:hypothetical protein
MKKNEEAAAKSKPKTSAAQIRVQKGECDDRREERGGRRSDEQSDGCGEEGTRRAMRRSAIWSESGECCEEGTTNAATSDERAWRGGSESDARSEREWSDERDDDRQIWRRVILD